MEALVKKVPVPPYVAYKTLKNFVERYKQGLPSRIDRGLMGSMSGSAQSQVTTALRYLGMITENDHPTEIMKRYVTGEEESQKAALREALQSAYPYIFNGSIDFSSVTGSQLRETFEAHTSATGETIGRCIAFLKDAAQDAGVIVSPFLTQKKPRGSSTRKKPPAARREDIRPSDRPPARTETLERPPAHVLSGQAQSSLLLTGLFQRLPKPGSVWPKDERERWVQTMNNVLLLEYPEA
jgi:hypothetical protein